MKEIGLRVTVLVLPVVSVCYGALAVQIVLYVIWPVIIPILLALYTSSDALQVQCLLWWRCWNCQTLGRKQLQVPFLCWLITKAAKTLLFQQV